MKPKRPITVFGVPPEELPAALARALRLIAEHKAARPSNLDIPAITSWAQDLHELETSLGALERQGQIHWKDVPVPDTSRSSHPLKPSIPKPNPPACAEQKPEAPLSRTAEDPNIRIKERMEKITTLTQEAHQATDYTTFTAKRQRIQSIRYEIQKIGRENGIPCPAFPELPSNPFTLGTPGVKPGAKRQPEPATLARPGEAEEMLRKILEPHGPVALIPDPPPAARAEEPEGPHVPAEFNNRVNDVVIQGLMEMARDEQRSSERIASAFEALQMRTPSSAHVHLRAAKVFISLAEEIRGSYLPEGGEMAHG